MSAKQPVWSWTDAVMTSDAAPLTKFVCLNIARYFSSAGTGWRIPVKKMIAETGLSNRSIATHLQLAADAKLLTIKRETGPHGQRGVTTYVPRFPDGTELKQEAEVPSEPASPGPSEGGSRGPSEPASLRPSEPASRQVPSQERTSQNNPPTPANGGLDVIASQFEEFWETYPRGVRARNKKHQARSAFASILAGEHRDGHRATASEMIDGAKRYAASRPDPDYVPMPVSWLNQARWLDEPEVPEKPRSKMLERVLTTDFGPGPRDTSETFADYAKRVGPDGKPKAAA